MDRYGRCLRAGSEWAFLRYRELLVFRLELPDVVVHLRGWGVSEGDLLNFVIRLQRMELGSDLLESMKKAQAASDAAWQPWYSSHGE